MAAWDVGESLEYESLAGYLRWLSRHAPPMLNSCWPGGTEHNPITNDSRENPPTYTSKREIRSWSL